MDAVIEDLVYYKDFNELVLDDTMAELYLKDYSKGDFINLLKNVITKY